MAIFVHLTPEKNLKSILRNGITRLTKRGNESSGVYATPVTQNYYASHQWVRELKRRKNEILRYRAVSQIIGWRYYPEAHGKKPCGCPYCQRGKYGGRKLRERYEKDLL